MEVLKIRELNKNLLLKLGFNINSIGFDYWLSAIEYFRQNYGRYSFNMQIMYEEIAKQYQTTATRVERSLRTASATAKQNIQKYFEYYNKITNKTILILFNRSI